MNEKIDWQDCENVVYSLGKKISEQNTSVSDIELALIILKVYPSRRKFTMADIYEYLKPKYNITKEKIATIIFELGTEISIVKIPQELPYFRVHEMYYSS